MRDHNAQLIKFYVCGNAKGNANILEKSRMDTFTIFL